MYRYVVVQIVCRDGMQGLVSKGRYNDSEDWIGIVPIRSSESLGHFHDEWLDGE